MPESVTHEHSGDDPQCHEFDQLQADVERTIREHLAVTGPSAGTRDAVDLLVGQVLHLTRLGHDVAARLDQVAEALLELRLRETRPDDGWPDELPNAKAWARNIERWDEENPVLGAFLAEAYRD